MTTAKFEFETANDLAKFLSDKLRTNPGTHKPAKLLHWMAEFQGFRNARTFKEAPAPVVLENASRMKLDGDKAMTLVGYNTRKPSDTWGPSQEDARNAMACFIRSRVENFVLDHLGQLQTALRIKLLTPSIPLKDAFFTKNLESTSTGFFGLLNDDAVWAAEKGLTSGAWQRVWDILSLLREPNDNRAIAHYVYTHASKAVLEQLLNDLDTTCSEEVTTVEALIDVYEIRERLRDVCEKELPGWVGGFNGIRA